MISDSILRRPEAEGYDFIRISFWYFINRSRREEDFEYFKNQHKKELMEKKVKEDKEYEIKKGKKNNNLSKIHENIDNSINESKCNMVKENNEYDVKNNNSNPNNETIISFKEEDILRKEDYNKFSNNNKN